MKQTLRAALCGLGLSLCSAYAADGKDSGEIQLGDVFNILLGAYNGAADVAEQRGHSLFSERLSKEDAARLERGLNQLQQELKGIVHEDGTLDSERAAALLNELQQLRGGTRFDFVQAEQALRRAQEGGELSLDGVLGAMAAGGAALSAEVEQLQRLAAEQIGGTYSDALLADLLKLVYADREFDSVDPAREEKAHALLAQVMEKGGVSEARYEEIRKLLDAIGRPFKDDYKAWKRARDKMVRRELNRREMGAVLEMLQNKDLTPEQRERILDALKSKEK